jgi:hypothetical protein
MATAKRNTLRESLKGISTDKEKPGGVDDTSGKLKIVSCCYDSVLIRAVLCWRTVWKEQLDNENIDRPVFHWRRSDD